MAIDTKYMTTEEVALSLQTARLEQQYERALQQAERIYEEERTRTLRLQLLILEHENDDLRDHVQHDEDEMQKLELVNEEIRETLGLVEADFQAVQTQSKTYSRDIERYKAEIASLDAANNDSTKLLSEKLALSRELGLMKAELDHLKSQAATQNNVLADKLGLERELSAIRVELETEKRAVHRLKTQEKTSSGEVVMIDEIERLKKDVAKEKKNLQSHEREHMRKATEWDTLKESLEAKLEAFRSKLRTTKEQLKEAQDELEKAQTAKFARATEAAKARMEGGAGSENPKKRNVAHFDPDMTIGTPGNGGPAAKKQRSSVLPGDKSTFSITPFLNRTMSVLPESPSEEQTEHTEIDNLLTAQIDKAAEEAEKSTAPTTTKSTSKKPLPSSTKEKGNATAQTLKPSSASQTNKAGAAAAAAAATTKKSSLPKVTEEDEEEKAENPNPTKRKILQSNRPTIFDDDDADTAPRRMTKKLNLAGLRGGGGSGIGLGGTMNLKKINIGGGKSKVLAEFSPLKKDRRVVV